MLSTVCQGMRRLHCKDPRVTHTHTHTYTHTHIHTYTHTHIHTHTHTHTHTHREREREKRRVSSFLLARALLKSQLPSTTHKVSPYKH
jgi:hypothetical protein